MNSSDANFPSKNDYQLVTDDLIRLLEIVFVIPINCFVSLSGMLANILNVMILARLGFKQTMSYGTMALSVTDLTVSSLQLTSEICYILSYILEDSEIDFMSIGLFPVGWLRYAALYISGWITALIAMERCFCVVFPFTVKQICNKTLYAVVMLVIYSVYLGFVIPIIIADRLSWYQVSDQSVSNSTQKYKLTVILDDVDIRLQKLFDSVCVFGFALFSQIILLVSTLYMAYALKGSSKIRNTYSNSKDPNETKQILSFMSLKERKLIVVAIRLAVVVLACSVPRYIVIGVFAIVPTLQAPENLSFACFLYDVSDMFINANCFCTFFVYASVNKNFKTIFKTYFNFLI
ncbi:neuromedin-U receptor 2 [Biomphalaria glabrata]